MVNAECPSHRPWNGMLYDLGHQDIEMYSTIHFLLGLYHGPLARNVKLWVAHVPGMPGTFSLATDFKGYCWLAVPACITTRASRTCRDTCRDCLPAKVGKTIPAFPAHAHPQFYVSGKRPIVTALFEMETYG